MNGGGGRAPASRSWRPRPAPPPPPGRIRFPHPGPASGLALAAPPACQGWDLGAWGAGACAATAGPAESRALDPRAPFSPPGPRPGDGDGRGRPPPPPPAPAAARCGRMWRRAADAGAVPGGADSPSLGRRAPAAGAALTRANKVGCKQTKLAAASPSLSASTRLMLGLAARRILAGWRRASGQAQGGLTWPGAGPPPPATPPPPPHTLPPGSPLRSLGGGAGPAGAWGRDAGGVIPPSPPKGASPVWSPDPVLPSLLDASEGWRDRRLPGGRNLYASPSLQPLQQTSIH